jgi:uncharacterized RDD family membrane protein YckC
MDNWRPSLVVAMKESKNLNIIDASHNNEAIELKEVIDAVKSANDTAAQGENNSSESLTAKKSLWVNQISATAKSFLPPEKANFNIYWRRLEAYLIDVLIIGLIAYPIGLIVSFCYYGYLTDKVTSDFAIVQNFFMYCPLGLSFLSGLFTPLLSSLTFWLSIIDYRMYDNLLEHNGFLFVWFLLLPLLINYFYRVGFESSKFKATPGKIISRLYISTTDNKALSWAQATKRFLLLNAPLNLSFIAVYYLSLYQWIWGSIIFSPVVLWILSFTILAITLWRSKLPHSLADEVQTCKERLRSILFVCLQLCTLQDRFTTYKVQNQKQSNKLNNSFIKFVCLFLVSIATGIMLNLFNMSYFATIRAEITTKLSEIVSHTNTKEYIEDEEELASLIENKANLYASTEDMDLYAKASIAHDKAYKSAKIVYGEDHPETYAILANLIETWYYNNEIEELLTDEKSQKTNPITDKKLTHLMRTEGSAYALLDSLKNAPNNETLLLKTKAIIGLSEFLHREYELSEKYLLEVTANPKCPLDILKRYDRYDLIEKIAKAQEKQKKYNEAITTLLGLVQSIEKLKEEDRNYYQPTTDKAKKKIASLYKKLGKHKEAEKILATIKNTN